MGGAGCYMRRFECEGEGRGKEKKRKEKGQSGRRVQGGCGSFRWTLTVRVLSGEDISMRKKGEGFKHDVQGCKGAFGLWLRRILSSLRLLRCC